MRKSVLTFLGSGAVLAMAGYALAQETPSDEPAATATIAPATPPPAAAPAPQAPARPKPGKPLATVAKTKPGEPFDPFKMGQPPPPPALKPTTPVALVMRALDKITGRATVITAPINQPIQYATLTIVARYCYSTPQSETPETSAFVQIEDHRPDQKARRVFSGWMYASSPGLNGMEHPLYDVWVIRCRTDAPGVAKSVAAAVKPKSPNAAATDEPVDLPEDADQ